MSNEFGRAGRVEDELIRRVERGERYIPAPPLTYEGGGVTCFRRDDAPVVRPTATPVPKLPVREPVVPMATVTVMCSAQTPIAPEPMRVINSPAPRSDLAGWDFSRRPRVSKLEKREMKAAKAVRHIARRLTQRLEAVETAAIIDSGWSRRTVQEMINSEYPAWGLARLEALVANLETMSSEIARGRSCRVEQKVAAQAK